MSKSVINQRPSKIFVNSLPKSGTGLLAKLVELLDYKQQSPSIGRHTGLKGLVFYPFSHAWSGPSSVLVGVDMPYTVQAGYLNKIFSRLLPGRYTLGHVLYSDHSSYLLRKHDIKTLFIFRDPRDIVVSHVFHICKNNKHPLHHFYTNNLMDFKDRLNFSIAGGQAGNVYLEGIGSRVRSMLGWMKCSTAYGVKFEHLIGIIGGGSADLQETCIKQVCDFLGEKITGEKLNAIISNLHGGTVTFRKGQIGGWREYFDEKTLSLFIENAADALEVLDYGT